VDVTAGQVLDVPDIRLVKTGAIGGRVHHVPA